MEVRSANSRTRWLASFLEKMKASNSKMSPLVGSFASNG